LILTVIKIGSSGANAEVTNKHFQNMFAVPLLARFVKKVLWPLLLLAPSSAAHSYSRANVCAKLLALNPSLMLFWLAKNG